MIIAVSCAGALGLGAIAVSLVGRNRRPLEPTSLQASGGFFQRKLQLRTCSCSSYLRQWLALVWALCGLLALTSCGDLPRPFAGNPGRAALALAVPPPPRLIVPPSDDSLLPASQSQVWAKAVTDTLNCQDIPAFLEKSHPGEWQLRLSATVSDGVVTPKYTYVDPKGKTRGEVTGVTVAAADWTSADATIFQQNAVRALPQIMGLLKAVDANIKQSDPNSLYNRPARVFFSGVTGAPGDGDVSLARGMRIRLPDTGDQLVEQATGADFTLRGTVKVSDVAGGQQQVEIHWLVTDANGRVAGDIAQGHDVPKGTLDHYWGDVAAAITEEAAGGVHEVITNYSGRRS
jgi:hypothetical protein